MILEMAVLQIKNGLSKEFEQAFSEASPLIACQKGYRSHELKKCIEEPDKYLLLVQWETLEDHEKGFRRSAEYLQWKKKLHHFYHPFPKVEHYK